MSESHYTVTATNVAPDASVLDGDLGRRPVGELGPDALVSLMAKFAALANACDVEFEPHFTIAGNAGTFIARAGTGTALQLCDVTDASRTFCKVEPADIPSFIEHGPGSAPEPTTTSGAVSDAHDVPPPAAPRRSTAKAVFASLAALSGVVAVVVSVPLSLAPVSIDAEVSYVEVKDPAEISRLRASASGDYAISNSNRGAITIQSDGTFRYTSLEHNGAIASSRAVPTVMARLPNQNLVLRSELGPIEIRDTSTVRYAGETWMRKR